MASFYLRAQLIRHRPIPTYPVPARDARPPLTTDAELVASAVCQAAVGSSSDRQFLGLVGRALPGWFPHLPDQSQYNRRLRTRACERLATSRPQCLETSPARARRAPVPPRICDVFYRSRVFPDSFAAAQL
jgi:hypothetical protein